MDQFVPDVSENDITRVVGRDFSAGVHDVIYEMIRRLEVRARDEKERIIEKDKKQYVAWLRAADADETRSEA